jgi:hypothetical protein
MSKIANLLTAPCCLLQTWSKAVIHDLLQMLVCKDVVTRYHHIPTTMYMALKCGLGIDNTLTIAEMSLSRAVDIPKFVSDLLIGL